jgi:hypothetical protein
MTLSLMAEGPEQDVRALTLRVNLLHCRHGFRMVERYQHAFSAHRLQGLKSDHLGDKDQQSGAKGVVGRV